MVLDALGREVYGALGLKEGADIQVDGISEGLDCMFDPVVACLEAEENFSRIFDPSSQYFRRGVMLFSEGFNYPLAVLKLVGERTALGLLDARGYGGRFNLDQGSMYKVEIEISEFFMEKKDGIMLPKETWGTLRLESFLFQHLKPLDDFALEKYWGSRRRVFSTTIAEEMVNISDNSIDLTDNYREEVEIPL